MYTYPSSALPSPLISIIVPVYNRADEIDEFLGSCSMQKSKNFEVIIVDDGSTDNLKEIVEKYKPKLDIYYFYEQNRGPGAARNMGMDKANGRWFVFIDSDCTISPDYIANLEAHLKKEDFDAFGGPDTYREDFLPFLKAVNYSMTSFIGTGGTRGSKKSVTKYYPRSFNMGIKREVYERIGGMKDLRHGQDMEFSNRIYKADFKVKFFPDVFVYHRRRTNLRRFFKQIFNWGATRVNLGRLDKEMLKPVHALPAVLLLIFICTILLAVFVPFFIYVLWAEIIIVLAALIFAFLQSTIRYHSPVVGLLSMVTLITQIVAYGSGFWYSVILSVFRPGKFVRGFTKKYYE